MGTATEATLGPIKLAWDGPEIILRFLDPGGMMVEIPSNLERELTELMSEHHQAWADKPWCVDLEHVPTFSSRQLGILLTVRKVREPWGPVTLRGLAEPVASLLEVTKMNKLFKVEG